MKLYEKGLDREQILKRLDQISNPDNAQGEYNVETDTVALLSDYFKQSEDPLEAQKELIRKYRNQKQIIDVMIMMFPHQTPSIEDIMANALENESK